MPGYLPTVPSNDTRAVEEAMHDVADGKYEITIYTSCCNASRGIYYYTTYDNSRVTAVDMHRENLDDAVLSRYSMLTEMDILLQNA